MVFALIAKRPSSLASASSTEVMRVFSLSEAVIVSTSPFTSKRKQSRIEILFFVEITLPIACRCEASSVHERVNFMMFIILYFISVIISDIILAKI